MKHVATSLILLAIVISSCVPTQVIEPVSTATLFITPSATITNTPKPTATIPPTDTPKPTPKATRTKLSGDPNEENRKIFLDSLKQYLLKNPLINEHIKEVKSIALDNGTLDIELVTNDDTKMGQQMEAYFIIMFLGPELTKNPEKEFEILAKGKPFLLRFVAYSYNGLYRYTSESSYATLKKFAEKLPTHTEWQIDSNGTFEDVNAPSRAVEIATITPSGDTEGCPQGCLEEKTGCSIKGNISSDGEKIYHVPGSSSYKNTKINPANGERWFCTADEAVANGWRAPRN